MYKDINFKVVDFNNAEQAIKIQRGIFSEDGMINIIASLDRDLFMKCTGINYPDDNIKYYLAYIKDVPIGITGFYTQSNEKEEMWLAWFGVLPEYRGKGYGTVILKWSMDKVLDSGRKTLRLYTDDIENKEAINLYKKLGFKGEKYSAEKLSYDCYIYSKSLVNEKIKLWGNKKLKLVQQSDFENINEKDKEKIYSEYKEKYFKE